MLNQSDHQQCLRVKSGVIDKMVDKIFCKLYVCWFNIKSKTLNKKNVNFVIVQLQENMELEMKNNAINV